MLPTRALTRAIPASFVRALARNPLPLDPERAANQHASYVDALRWMGLKVEVLPALEAHPDCCFVEDTAIIAHQRVLFCRSGAPSRRGEVHSIASHLSFPQKKMEAPATLDGGDCLYVGGTWFVGQSHRSNAEALSWVQEAFPEDRVVPVPVTELHLKCSVSALSPECVLLAENSIPVDVFRGIEVVMVPEEESYAANVVAVGKKVLVAEGYPETARRLEARGYVVRRVDNGELKKADGALTCLSILW